MPLDRITWLLGLLILPWMLKFLWAPAIDFLRSPGFGFRHWAMIAQSVMVLSLAPLLHLDLGSQFSLIAGFLLLHALAASTQDVAIDALCIQTSHPDERPSLNGWMQVGMLGGRALMGGGSLLLEQWLGYSGVIVVLMLIILFSGILLWASSETIAETQIGGADASGSQRTSSMSHRLIEMKQSFATPAVWLGIGFALTGPAAFKSLEAVIGPYLIDHGFSELEIGSFTSFFMLCAMVLGSLSVGLMAGRFSAKALVAVGLVSNLCLILVLASVERFALHWEVVERGQNTIMLVLLTAIAATIGFLTVSMYSWLMNCTDAKFAATQFTLFMACTNACEAWSTMTFGRLQVQFGYSFAMMTMVGLSAAGLALLHRSRPDPKKF